MADQRSMIFKGAAALSLFPTLVIVRDLAPDAAARIGTAIAARLAALIAARPAEQAAGQQWQSHTALHDDPAFGEFCACVHQAGGEYLRLMDYRDAPLEITGCWANISPVGAAHHIHSHPNNLFSGVYYLQADAGANTITFHDPRAQAHVITPHVERTSGLNAVRLAVEARAGRFYLFPGWLAHSVDANRSGRDRVSVSFNLMLPRFTETVSRPRWQGRPLDA
jgi:uncharacterized protein (TIGR02466 family)